MSVKKYDIESFRDDVINMIIDGLPAKIAAINAEKNDDYILTDIDVSNYYNDITDQVSNISPFIYYGLSGVEVATNGAASRLDVTMFVSIVFDNSNKPGVENLMLRYTRCLREIIQENYKKKAAASPLKVDEFVPANFSLNKGSDFKIGGIHVTATLQG